jgi:hypothetical protein
MTTKTHAEAVAARELASKHVYDAEGALRAALQTDVDEWIQAAADKLHAAVVELEAADRALGHFWTHAA